jgi:hypothetical protein
MFFDKRGPHEKCSPYLYYTVPYANPLESSTNLSLVVKFYYIQNKKVFNVTE